MILVAAVAMKVLASTRLAGVAVAGPALVVVGFASSVKSPLSRYNMEYMGILL